MIIGVLVIVFIFFLYKIVVFGFEGDFVFGYKVCKIWWVIFLEIIYFYVVFNIWLLMFIIVSFNMMIIFEIKKN